ncbi:ABC transporter ATP-binding protein [Methylocapsa polymorpha]|uniref:ABC transporter ATP-binding protein n=1 Tax=Methylocapsa polymorpha TaxID=3080828 RepID=A0ABZ0HWQ1_9HYPH|nr:ABC transporter ATP-binding protein [Methylocapsa sp. RX1]
MSMIEFREVSKAYQSRVAIDAISLKVERGERVVLFGPSGCGKSTLLHLIAGLAKPDSGDILIDGELAATAGKNLQEPEQRGIGMVFQDLALWSHMTVAENIEFGLIAKRVANRERRQRVREMVDLVRLGDYLNARPGTLSGGEQQRVALARALATAPRILLMDEPLSNLDDELSLQMRQEILRLHYDIGFTLVYVTHSHNEAKELGTRTIRLRQGRIDSASNGAAA